MTNATDFNGLQYQTQYRFKNHEVNDKIVGRILNTSNMNFVSVEWRFIEHDIRCFAILDLSTMRMIQGEYHKKSVRAGTFVGKRIKK